LHLGGAYATDDSQELWQKTDQPAVEEELKRRKWRWIGNTLRKPKHNITNVKIFEKFLSSLKIYRYC
jgi:hypothetical protein